MEELIKEIQEEIKEAYKFFEDEQNFDNEQHFQDVIGEAGWNEDNMRVFDCGYIKGMQNALSKLQEQYGETE